MAIDSKHNFKNFVQDSLASKKSSSEQSTLEKIEGSPSDSGLETSQENSNSSEKTPTKDSNNNNPGSFVHQNYSFTSESSENQEILINRLKSSTSSQKDYYLEDQSILRIGCYMFLVQIERIKKN